MIKINYYDGVIEVELKVAQYRNGRTAIHFIEDGMPFGKLTTNVEADVTLDKDEILVKTWSENEGWVPQLLKSHPTVFQNTGREVESGFVKVQIWKFYPENLPS